MLHTFIPYFAYPHIILRVIENICYFQEFNEKYYFSKHYKFSLDMYWEKIGIAVCLSCILSIDVQFVKFKKVMASSILPVWGSFTRISKMAIFEKVPKSDNFQMSKSLLYLAPQQIMI